MSPSKMAAASRNLQCTRRCSAGLRRGDTVQAPGEMSQDGKASMGLLEVNRVVAVSKTCSRNAITLRNLSVSPTSQYKALTEALREAP